MCIRDSLELLQIRERTRHVFDRLFESS